MALFLSEIDPKVKAELYRRQDMVKGNDDKYKLEPVRKDNVDRGGLYNRSTWIRITPNSVLMNETKSKQIESKPVLMGGTLYVDSTGKSTGLTAGVGNAESNLYKDRTFKSGYVPGAGHRPGPGVKSVSVRTKGDLGTITEIDVEWVCWSFSDLDRMSYYYMRPGASITCEFGWSGQNIKSAPPSKSPEQAMFAKYDWIDPNMEYYSGVISNFEWNGNADGGFDCKTTIVAGGSLLMQQELKTRNQSADSPSSSGYGGLRDFLVEENGKQVYWLCAAAVQAGSVGCKALVGGDDSDTHGDHHAWMSMGWVEDNLISKFAGYIVPPGKNDKGSVEKSLLFRSFELVTWEEGDKAQGIWVPTRITGHPNIVSVDPMNVFIPNNNLGENNVQIGKYVIDDGWFWDSKDWSAAVKAFRWQDNFYNIASDSAVIFKNGKPTLTQKDYTKFSWRNIIVSNKLLAKAAKKSSNINDFFGYLFDAINSACGNLWNFKLVIDDNNSCQAKVIDTNYTDMAVQEALDNTSEAGQPGKPNYRPFVFPAMGRNSIVKTQKMNMKIPDSAALSAMYTSNNTNAQDSLSKDGGQLRGENSPGGSEVDNDIVMNVLSSMTTRHEAGNFRAVDEVLKDIDGTPINFGSKDPYFNYPAGNGATFSIKDCHKKIENKGKLYPNDSAVWKITIPKLTALRATGQFQNTGNNSKDATATNQAKGNKDKYEAGDKAQSLSGVLKDLGQEDDGKGYELPDELTELLNNDKYEDLENASSQVIEDFFKDFIEATWAGLKEKGGGWIIPQQLRSYWFWAIKFLGISLKDKSKGNKLNYFSNQSTEDKENTGMAIRTSYLLPIELELEVDGVGGIKYGNSFQSEYLPPKYLNSSLFQCTEIGHSISNDGWYTTLKGKMRYIPLNEARERWKK